MAENLSVEAPPFDLIENETGLNTRNAINLLWRTLNFEIGRRRQETRLTREHAQPKVLTLTPTVSQNDLDLTGAGVLLLTGTTAVNITGFRAPNPGESYAVLVAVIGSATITLKNASGSSQTGNQIRTFSAGDLAIATDKFVWLNYLNSLWREAKLA